MASRLSVIRTERIKKVEELRKLGIDPYPSRSQMKLIPISFAIKSIGKQVNTAGRLMSMRGHGAILFGDVRDESGQIQVFFREDNLKDNINCLS